MEEQKQNGQIRFLAVKPWHLGAAAILQIVAMVVGLGVFYGTIRTQVDDDRGTIKEMKATITSLSKDVSDLKGMIYNLQGRLGAALHLK